MSHPEQETVPSHRDSDTKAHEGFLLLLLLLLVSSLSNMSSQPIYLERLWPLLLPWNLPLTLSESRWSRNISTWSTALIYAAYVFLCLFLLKAEKLNFQLL